MAQEERFLTAFGLRVERVGAVLQLRADTSDHVWTKIVPRVKRRLVYVSFGWYKSNFSSL